MINRDKLPNLVVNHVVLGNTMINKDNQVVHYVLLGNTMINKDKLLNQVVKTIAVRDRTLLLTVVLVKHLQSVQIHKVANPIPLPKIKAPPVVTVVPPCAPIQPESIALKE